MKIILTTETSMSAVVLKNQIIAAVKGELVGQTIDTWSYIKSGDNFDVLFHNPPQYTETPESNVLFKVEVEGLDVYLSTAWWKSKPQPSREMSCLHTGKLTEMILRYFSSSFIKFSIVDY